MTTTNTKKEWAWFFEDPTSPDPSGKTRCGFVEAILEKAFLDRKMSVQYDVNGVTYTAVLIVPNGQSMFQIRDDNAKTR